MLLPQAVPYITFLGDIFLRLLKMLIAPLVLFTLVSGVCKMGDVRQLRTVGVRINGEAGFSSHAKLADFASEYLVEELGEAGIGSRAAIGIASLPGEAPVEVQMVLMASEPQ